MWRRTISVVILAACLTSGCATLREDPSRCRIVTTAASAVIGAVVGGVATGAAGAEGGEIVAASVGGLAVGALVGLLLRQPVCGPAAEATPSPATAPPPAP